MYRMPCGTSGTTGHSAILGGLNNRIELQNCSTIVGGACNRQQGVYSAIVQGFCNQVLHGGCNFIGGGFCNNVDGAGAFSFIGSGAHNCALNVHSGVLLGSANTVNASYSTVLGGSGNTIGVTHAYSAIFGQNLNSAAANTFHVECLNAINTPVYNPLLPTGTIYYATSCPFPGACALYIM